MAAKIMKPLAEALAAFFWYKNERVNHLAWHGIIKIRPWWPSKRAACICVSFYVSCNATLSIFALMKFVSKASMFLTPAGPISTAGNTAGISGSRQTVWQSGVLSMCGGQPAATLKWLGGA